MKKLTLGALALTAALSGVSASATTINFDDLTNNAVVTNQYAGVSFSSIAGSDVRTTAQSLGSSTPNFICTATAGSSINCSDPLFVDFSTAVSGLSFVAVGDNQIGKNGEVKVYAGQTLLGTVDTFGDNVFTSTYLVDLSAFSGITRIAITNTDPGGLGYDDFTFDVGGAVPEPASWAMMIAGFGLVGAGMRRRAPRLALA